MPVRRQASGWLTEQIVGRQVWDGRNGQCVSIPTEKYDTLESTMDKMFVAFVQQIDWNRVCLEAEGRCLSLDHTHSENACGESIQEALLTLDRYQLDWSTERHAFQPDIDWPQAVADNLRYRRP